MYTFVRSLGPGGRVEFNLKWLNVSYTSASVGLLSKICRLVMLDMSSRTGCKKKYSIISKNSLNIKVC